MNELGAASERLALSRQGLRLALQPGGAAAGAARTPACLARGLDGLASVRDAGAMASDAAELVLLPLARAHPLRLVGGAFVVGALLAWSRPGSWLIRPAWFAVLPHLLSHVVAAATRPRQGAAPQPKNANPL